MKKFWSSIIIFTFCIAVAKAQSLQASVFAGFSNYQGDLQDKRFTLNQSHPAVGVGLVYDITPQLHARANVTFGKISGADRATPKNASRNLSFSSPITDVHLGLEYSILNPEDFWLSPYVFAGVSYFHFNPSAIDSAGQKVYLQPLSTEGQGFYQNRKPYQLNQWAIPFGGGIKVTLTDHITVAYEIGLRKTNTDYLDDVSTTYVDQNLLLQHRGQEAVNMAFRGGELKNGATYPADGTPRGSAKNKDWYYFSGINLIIRIADTGSESRSGRRYKTGCPANMF
ncbi:MAG: outer membrane beta-barrel protein [Bacteroidetes bacterium]|nr:outer membrane beta-barrel protein [Bacteroidota bacterium]